MRRLFDVRILLALGALAVVAVIAWSVSRPEQPDDKVLNIYNWSDYIGDDTIANFEKETGIKVHYDTFDTNEALHAKLLVGMTGYDIVVPSSNWARLQIQAGLLQKLDKSKISTWNNLDPDLMRQLQSTDPGNQYLAPWVWGVTTLGINVDKLKAALGPLPMPDNLWDLLYKPEYVSRAKTCGVSVLDSGDEVFAATLHYLGLPPGSESKADYEAAAALLATIRPSITMFSSSGYINELAAGSLCLSLGWNGDISIAAARAREAGNHNNIQVLIPKEGAVLLFDSMAIPADAPHKENAYRWISYIYRPEVNAAITNKVLYANPIPASAPFIRPDIRANRTVFMPREDLVRMVPPEIMQNAAIRRLRTRLYTTFKTAM